MFQRGSSADKVRRSLLALRSLLAMWMRCGKDLVHGGKAYAAQRDRAIRTQLRDPSARPVTLALLGMSVALALFLLVGTVLVLSTPGVGNLGPSHASEATIAYTADGHELTRYHFENRTWISLDEMSTSVVEALLATEDHRFYDHGGIDVRRVFGALFRTAAGQRQGGSTVTMQLARNVFPQLRDDAVLKRKIREWLTALRIESSYTKDEILEMYLNTVPFMYDAFGIEAAARTYFQKSAADLDVLESATLIGMLKGTVYYNPVRNPERAHARRNVVLRQMARHANLSPEQYAALSREEIELRFQRVTREDNLAPYFAEHLRQWLGEWAETHGYNLYTDGLRVYTTLDARLQEAAEAAVAEVTEDLQAVADVEWSSADPFFSRDLTAYRDRSTEPFSYFWEGHPDFLDELLVGTDRFRVLRGDGLSKAAALEALHADSVFIARVKQKHQRLEAGFVAVEPATGHIKAWVGGRDFAKDQYDHVALARRQPGSTFKPFVYAAALENGFAPNSMLRDQVTEFVDPFTRTSWRPRNFGGSSGALMTLRQALAQSKNTITAQLISEVGPGTVAELAHRAGIESELHAVPSLGLGTSEVTLLELTAAYATLADSGRHRTPVLVSRIEDRSGRTVATFSSEPDQALEPHVAYAVIDMMRGVIDRGTGSRLRYRFGARGDLAGKTGTTQGGADGWFMLAHPDLVMGSWMGFASPTVTFRSNYWGQGAHTALPIAGRFYQEVQRSGSNLLPTSAVFEPAPSPGWGSRGRTGADYLNVRERQRTNLDEILKQLRARKSEIL